MQNLTLTGRKILLNRLRIHLIISVVWQTRVKPCSWVIRKVYILSKLYYSKLNNYFSTLHTYFHYRQIKNTFKKIFYDLFWSIGNSPRFHATIKPEEATHSALANSDRGYESGVAHPFSIAGPVKEASESTLLSWSHILHRAGRFLWPYAISVQYHHLPAYLLPHILLPPYIPPLLQEVWPQLLGASVKPPSYVLLILPQISPQRPEMEGDRIKVNLGD